LPLDGVRVSFSSTTNDEFGASELREMKVFALALDDVGQALQQVDQLGVVDGDGRFLQLVTLAVFDPHRAFHFSISVGISLGARDILRRMPADLRLLDDEQRALVQMVREFADEVAAPASIGYEERSEDPAPLYKQLAELGLTGIPFPERYGGGDQPYGTYLLVIEELARAYVGFTIGLSVHTLCAFAVNRFGSDALKEDVLTRLCSGEWFGAYSLSEPNSGSDAAALSTKATREGDAYRLSGSKVFCTRGNEADCVLVMARTGEEGARGISTFIVERGTEGFGGSKKEDKMGWRSSPTWMLQFDGAEVPVSRLVGEEGQGFRIALASLDSGRLGIAACSIGLAQAALDEALAFTSEREQFGKPVNQNQGLQFMLADMSTAIEAGRRLYRHAAALRDAGEDYSVQAAQAKLFCSDVAMKVTTDAVQLHGGYGYITEYPVERYMREAKALQIVEGTNQIQRLVIGRRLTSASR
jgi:alkylation response protein AidB-like acyl-CoA dehydrogenase